MGMKDFFKKMVNLPADDEYEDDYYDEEEPSFFDEEEPEEKSAPASKPKKESTSFFSSTLRSFNPLRISVILPFFPKYSTRISSTIV